MGHTLNSGLLAMAFLAAPAQAAERVSPDLARAGLSPQNFAHDLTTHRFREELIESLEGWLLADRHHGGDLVMAGDTLSLQSSAFDRAAPADEPFDWSMALPRMAAHVLNQSDGVALPTGFQTFQVPEMRGSLSDQNDGLWMGRAFHTKDIYECDRFPKLTPSAEGPNPDRAVGVICEVKSIDLMNVRHVPTNATETQWLRVSQYTNVPVDYVVEGGIAWSGLSSGGRVQMSYEASIDLKGDTSIRVTVDFPENDCREATTWPAFNYLADNSPTIQHDLLDADLARNEDRFEANPEAYLELLSSGSYKFVVSTAHNAHCEGVGYNTAFPTDLKASLVKLAEHVID